MCAVSLNEVIRRQVLVEYQMKHAFLWNAQQVVCTSKLSPLAKQANADNAI